MEENKALDKRNIAGIVLVVVGGLLLLNTLNIVGFSMSHYIFSWKTLLIAIGAVIVFKRENQITGYMFIGVGVVFWALSFAGFYISFGKVFLPLMLIVIGIVVITRRGGWKNMAGKYATKTEQLIQTTLMMFPYWVEECAVFNRRTLRVGQLLLYLVVPNST